MDLSSLVQEQPLDATGVFTFNFDSYKCPTLDNTTGESNIVKRKKNEDNKLLQTAR